GISANPKKFICRFASRQYEEKAELVLLPAHLILQPGPLRLPQRPGAAAGRAAPPARRIALTPKPHDPESKAPNRQARPVTGGWPRGSRCCPGRPRRCVTGRAVWHGGRQ